MTSGRPFAATIDSMTDLNVSLIYDIVEKKEITNGIVCTYRQLECATWNCEILELNTDGAPIHGSTGRMEQQQDLLPQ